MTLVRAKMFSLTTKQPTRWGPLRSSVSVTSAIWGVRQIRELIAKWIIEAAKTGGFDPIRLHSQALMGFSIDDVSAPIVSVDRDPPVPVYALIACTA